MGATTAAPSPRTRRHRDRADPAHRLGAEGIVDQSGGIGEYRRVVRARRFGQALQRTPGDGIGRPRNPRWRGERDPEVYVREALPEPVLSALAGQQHGQVRRQRLEPADLRELHPGRFGTIVQGPHGLPDERDLPAEVGVVRASADARLEHGPSVEGVGAHEVEHHPGARGHGQQRGRIGQVGHHRLRCGHAHFGQDALELGRVACGRRPGRAGLRRALLEVGRHLPARDSRSPEHNDVEVLAGHLPHPTAGV